jgi:NADP-dependent 3-hydroxy acid dehydrogenase YdfG
MQRGNGLQHKRVVVLGGSSAIGLAVAEQGASVIIASSSAERVQKVVESIGGEAQGQAVDVSDERAMATFFSKLGTFDHLVFTAGDSLHLHDLAATDLQQARRAFELRYWAALAAVKYGSPHIRKEGSIVLTTGIAGQRPQKGWVIAASVCGTIEALTRARVGRGAHRPAIEPRKSKAARKGSAPRERLAPDTYRQLRISNPLSFSCEGGTSPPTPHFLITT